MRIPLLITLLGLILSFATLNCAKAQSLPLSHADSLMIQAQQLRDAGTYTMALDVYGQISASDPHFEQSRVERAKTYYEMGNVNTALHEANILLKLKNFSLADDALLVVARCREVLGYARASRASYRKLLKHGHTEGMYYYAMSLFSHGHDDEARTICQQAIVTARAQTQRGENTSLALAPAHQLLSSIEVASGHRYQALVALYRYILSCSDEGRVLGAKQLLTLWRREAQAIDLLRKRKPETDFSEKMEVVLSAICDTMPSVSPTKVGTLSADDLENIVAKTNAMASALRDMGEENLDFWQLNYGDLLVEMHARDYVRPMVYYMFEPVASATVLTWVNDNLALFREFSLWLEGRGADL